MIIGIDETGDFAFNSNKQNYFTAVAIDQNKNRYEIKKSQFNVWESSIPTVNRNEKGEAKGKLLTDQQLVEFFDQVLKPKPTVLYSVVRFNTIENPVEIVEKHKNIEVERLETALDYHKKEARGNWAEYYAKLLFWYKNRSYDQIVKIKCLENLIGQTFNYAFLWSQVRYLLDDKDDTNIKNFSFKIDKDFVKADNTKVLWNELLRQWWNHFNLKYKLPIIEVFKDVYNPIDEHYGGKSRKSDFKKIFRDRIYFLSSDENFEIRMADIVGTILHRHQNKHRCDYIAKEILKHLGRGKSDNYIQLILNDIKKG